jgi:putative transcriptional regulator
LRNSAPLSPTKAFLKLFKKGTKRLQNWIPTKDQLVPIIIKLDLILAKKKLRSKDLAEEIGITEQNLSILKTGKARALRLSTLEMICKTLECQPGDLLEYHPSKEV